MFLIAILGVALFPCMVSAQVEAGLISFTGTVRSSLAVPQGKVLRFADIVTNHGGAFSKASGNFTCQRNGLYVLGVNGVAQVGKEFAVDIRKNDAYVVSAVARNGDNFASGSNSVVLRLLKGDVVNVQTRRDTEYYGDSSHVYVTFQGFLLGFLSIPDKF